MLYRELISPSLSRGVKFLTPLFYFFAIVFSGQTLGQASLLGHGFALVFALVFIRRACNYNLFFLLLIWSLFSSNLRLSFEAILLNIGFLFAGLKLAGDQYSRDFKINFLLLTLFILWFLERFHCAFGEHGALLLFSPLLLQIIFDDINSITKFRTILLSLISIVNNKKTILLSFFWVLLNKIPIQYKVLISSLIFLSSLIVLGDDFSPQRLSKIIHHQELKILTKSSQHFWNKSCAPRLHIIASSLKGFGDKPLTGHGYGNFAVDFPAYRMHGKNFGSQDRQLIAHGHSMLGHCLFELGILGLVILFLFACYLWFYSPSLLMPMFIIMFCDAALLHPAQYLILGIIWALATQASVRTVKNSPVRDWAWRVISITQSQVPQGYNWLKTIVFIFFVLLSLSSFVGHYFYNIQAYKKSCLVDPLHPLYHFSLGANSLGVDSELAQTHLLRAVQLAPNVSYFQGFLAANYLANSDFPNTQKHINQAIILDGSDAYWHVIRAFSFYTSDKASFEREFAQALRLNPEIEDLLHDPQQTANEFIGSSHSDPRLISFRRTGKPIPLPLPYIAPTH